jgi:hypothetical protein
MFHDNRVWCVTRVASPEELAQKLTTVTWCCCTGFALDGYLWLNDATSPDGAQEYAVLKMACGNGKAVQIESITFGWSSEAEALAFIRHTLSGADDQNGFHREVEPRFETPAEHRCGHCA